MSYGGARGCRRQLTSRGRPGAGYERPRWAIQLSKLAQEAALRHNWDRITKDSIDEVWGEYGVKRIEDLVAEHKHQCPQVSELINAFRGWLSD